MVTVPEHLPAPAAVSQLIWRALGPFGKRARTVSEWAGLGGGQPATITVIAHRIGVSTNTVHNWIGIVKAAALELTLPDPLVHALTRPSTDPQEHTARLRQARLFGVPEPVAPPARRATVTAEESGLLAAAQRILAALGPLPVDELADALARRTRPNRPAAGIVDAAKVRDLARRSTTITIGTDHLCDLTNPSEPAARDLALLTAARRSGRSSHTLRQIRELLNEAGYTGHLGPTVAYHPLLIHLDRGYYEIRQPHNQDADVFES